MTRPTIEDVKRRHLADMTVAQRAEFAETSGSTRLALEVGEQVGDARKAPGLAKRELAARAGTGRAEITRVESGGTGTTLAALLKIAAAMDLKVAVELSAAN